MVRLFRTSKKITDPCVQLSQWNIGLLVGLGMLPLLMEKVVIVQLTWMLLDWLL